MPKFDNPFAEMIREIRHLGIRSNGRPGEPGRPWPLEEFARAVKRSPDAVRKWERGEGGPNTTIQIEEAAFGDNPAWDAERRRLRAANEMRRHYGVRFSGISVRPDEGEVQQTLTSASVEEDRARAWPNLSDPAVAHIVQIVGEQMAFPLVRRNRMRVSSSRPISSAPDLATLRVGVIGGSGLRSLVTMLLAQLDVSEIVAVEDGVMEEANLSRVLGSACADVDAKMSKVDILVRAVAQWGLRTRIVPIRDKVDSAASREGLRLCKVIFNCTEDQKRRTLPKRFAFFPVPIIDVETAARLWISS